MLRGCSRLGLTGKGDPRPRGSTPCLEARGQCDLNPRKINPATKGHAPHPTPPSRRSPAGPLTVSPAPAPPPAPPARPSSRLAIGCCAGAGAPGGVINEGLMTSPKSTEKSMGRGARAAAAQSRWGGRRGRQSGRGGLTWKDCGCCGRGRWSAGSDARPALR